MDTITAKLDEHGQTGLDRVDGGEFHPVLARWAWRSSPYMIWSGRMGAGARSGAGRRRWSVCRRRRSRWCGGAARWDAPSSGNSAFDEYREETLRRLEDEQSEFQRIPRAPAPRQGQGRVRPVHGRPAPPPGRRPRADRSLITPRRNENSVSPGHAVFLCAAFPRARVAPLRPSPASARRCRAAACRSRGPRSRATRRSA